MAFKVGDKIKFAGEKQKYTIKAASDRYLICTKPLYLYDNCICTIVDFERGVRGTNNLVFNIYDYMIQEDINNCLKDLLNGDVEVSRRNCVSLSIEGGETCVNT